MVGSSPVAGPSDTTRIAEAQLGARPWFAYPKPTQAQIEEELPPYFENENVPLGLILERLTVKGHEDMRRLLADV
jgi:mediator of RNA polymerase II transcription subunit 14